MSEDPWLILSLNRDSATEKEVKVAYARLLKLHRPDADPEGFQRVRAAYEAVLASLRSPKTTDENSHLSVILETRLASSASTTVPVNHAAEHAEVTEAVAGLRTALSTRIRQKIREAWVKLDQASNSAKLSYESRYRNIIDVCTQNLPLMAEVCSDERLVQHIEQNEQKLPHLVIEIWSREGDVNRLAGFSTTLNRARHLMGTESSALAMVQIAAGLGPWQPDESNLLAQKAFPYLPTEKRAELTSAVDHEVLLGRIISPLPNDQKKLWLGFLKGTTQRSNWRDQTSRQMLASLLRYCGPRWPGFVVLQNVMESAAWADFVHGINSVVQ